MSANIIIIIINIRIIYYLYYYLLGTPIFKKYFDK